MSAILERITQVRETLGYSQRKFASLIGKTGSYLSQINQGNAPVTPSLIDAIVFKLNVNREWLTTGEGEMFNKPAESTKATSWALM